MKHIFSSEGYCYKLRPVTLNDAAFIFEINLKNRECNSYMREIPNVPELLEKWIEKYFQREGEYCFIIVNKFTGIDEGMLAIYNENGGKAELGHWGFQKGLMASVESIYLLFQIAFRKLHLNELVCRTIEDDQAVVAFNATIGLVTRTVLADFYIFNDCKYNAIEQFIEKDAFEDVVAAQMADTCFTVFQRFLREVVGKFEFHHIGIACRDIESEITVFKMLGYRFEENLFVDSNQGITGKFGYASNQPHLELLQNLENSKTLNSYLDKGIKMYHYGYLVSDIEKTMDYITKCNGKMISPLKLSTYFGKRICFFVLSNLFMIELIEE